MNEIIQRAAFHEAGHVVALLSLNIPFDSVFVYSPTCPVSSHLGGVLGIDETHSADKRHLIITSFAGPIAEALLYDGDPDLTFTDSSREDRADIARYAAELDLSSEMLGELHDFAYQLVKNRYCEIWDTAAALLSVKGNYLSYERIKPTIASFLRRRATRIRPRHYRTWSAVRFGRLYPAAPRNYP